MPRNQLKRFPTAILRRGMAHFHPSSNSPGSIPIREREARVTSGWPVASSFGAPISGAEIEPTLDSTATSDVEKPSVTAD